MKKIAVIFLLGIFTLNNTQAFQLLKVKVFITHYLNHKHTDGLSFMEFIKMHYGVNMVIDDDFSEDQKLPFNQASDLHQSVFIGLEQVSLVCTAPDAPNFKKHLFPLPKDQDVYDNSLSSIWQPPKA